MAAQTKRENPGALRQQNPELMDNAVLVLLGIGRLIRPPLARTTGAFGADFSTGHLPFNESSPIDQETCHDL